MVGRLLRNGLLAVCLLASLQSTLQRSLQQASQNYRISTKLYSGVANGGLFLASNYTLTYASDGTVSAGTVNTSSPGYPLTLIPGDLLLSDTYKRVGCFQVGLTPSSSGIGGFVSTYANVLGTTTTTGIFQISTAIILGGSNVSTADGSVHSASANASDEYVFAVYNLGNSINTTKVQITAQTGAGCSQAPAPSQATPFLASSPSTSNGANNTALSPSQNASTVGILPVQNTTTSPSGRRLKQFYGGGSGYSYTPAEGPTLNQQYASEVNSPAPGPSATQTDSIQLTRQEVLSDSRLIWLGGFTNVSCVAYKLLGQAETLGRVPSRNDLSVFLLDESNAIAWANQEFSLTPDNINFLAIGLQNNNNSGDMFIHADGLNSSTKYFLWVVTGMQQPSIVSSNVILDLAYTAQSSGSCSNNQVSQYSGSFSEYDGSLVSPAASPSSGSAASAVTATPSTSAGPSAGATPATTPTAAPPAGLQLQGQGSTSGGSGGLFSLPGKKLKLLR